MGESTFHPRPLPMSLTRLSLPSTAVAGRWDWFWFSLHHFLTHSRGQSKKSWLSILGVFAYTLLSRFRLMTWVVYFMLHRHPFIANFARMFSSLTVYVEQLLASSSHWENMMTAALPSHPTRIAHTLFLLFVEEWFVPLIFHVQSIGMSWGFHNSGKDWQLAER